MLPIGLWGNAILTHDACMVRYVDLGLYAFSQKDALVVGRTRPGQGGARVTVIY